MIDDMDRVDRELAKRMEARRDQFSKKPDRFVQIRPPIDVHKGANKLEVDLFAYGNIDKEVEGGTNLDEL